MSFNRNFRLALPPNLHSWLIFFINSSLVRIKILQIYWRDTSSFPFMATLKLLVKQGWNKATLKLGMLQAQRQGDFTDNSTIVLHILGVEYGHKSLLQVIIVLPALGMDHGHLQRKVYYSTGLLSSKKESCYGLKSKFSNNRWDVHDGYGSSVFLYNISRLGIIWWHLKNADATE
jgi:hypothetical protein